MPLILTITPPRGAGDRQIRALAQGTLTIGRAAGNDWVLADPDQHLSRTHCMVASEDGRYVLTDLSTNGLLINGAREPTTRNARFILTDGDTIRLGSYTLEIAEADGAIAGSSSNPFGAGNFLTPRADAAAGGRGGDSPLDIDPLDDPLGNPSPFPSPHGFPRPSAPLPPSGRGEDPFDVAEGQRQRPNSLDEDLFAGGRAAEAWQGPAQRDAGGAGSQAFSAPRPEPAVKFDEIDFDALIGDLMPSPAPPPAPPSKPAAATGPVPASFADSLDDLFADLEAAPTNPPKPVAARSEAPERTPAPPPAPPAPVAPVAAPSVAAPPLAAPSVAAPSVAAPSGAAAASAPALLAAFLDGAGLPHLDLSAQEPEAVMRAIGGLLRAFTSGTREVLISRGEVKHEMRVERTMIRSRDNNALKFSVSAEDALIALLTPNRPGYKAPLHAVDEAFTDIRSHEMAVMAGLQTALVALLKRFDPAALEARLQRGMLDSILPGARKARFWELFCTTYKEIANEAEDDFHSIFGREFARAYEAQLRNL